MKKKIVASLQGKEGLGLKVEHVDLDGVLSGGPPSGFKTLKLSVDLLRTCRYRVNYGYCNKKSERSFMNF